VDHESSLRDDSISVDEIEMVMMPTRTLSCPLALRKGSYDARIALSRSPRPACFHLYFFYTFAQ
jgi:hypothetical protein